MYDIVAKKTEGWREEEGCEYVKDNCRPGNSELCAMVMWVNSPPI